MSTSIQIKQKLDNLRSKQNEKDILYSLAVLASVSLASCNGDYEDWAQPQHNPQEASAAKYGITFTAGPEAECNMPDEDGVINLVTVNSTDANVTGYTLKDLKVNGEAIKKAKSSATTFR